MFQVCRCSSDGIGSVANLEAKRTYLVDPGYCLKCGSYRDLASSHAAADEAWIYIKRYNHFTDCSALVTSYSVDLPIAYSSHSLYTRYSILDRLQDAIFLKEISSAVLLDASRSLGQLRSIFHAYSKSIAEVSFKVSSSEQSSSQQRSILTIINYFD